MTTASDSPDAERPVCGPEVDVLMAVHNGAAWLEDVLAGLAAQEGVRIRLRVWDNASTDGTADLVKRLSPSAEVIRSEENIGFWAAMELLSTRCENEVLVALTDVQLAPDFLARATAAFADPTVGAVQGKLYQLLDGARTTVIDTVGFRIARTRRITIAGHGEVDHGQYDHQAEVFAVEGAAPVFRTRAFRDSAVDGHVIDPAYSGGPLAYGDDLDLGWRVSLFGWRQVLVPEAIAWHDRSTTHDTASGLRSHLERIPQRRAIPREKRILDWVNVRCTIVKNDATADLLRDLPFIVVRELAVLFYMLLVEPRTLVAVPRFVRVLPHMLRQRRLVQARARADLRQWIG
jgi:GT2 family glycosyltransferase